MMIYFFLFKNVSALKNQTIDDDYVYEADETES